MTTISKTNSFSVITDGPRLFFREQREREAALSGIAPSWRGHVSAGIDFLAIIRNSLQIPANLPATVLKVVNGLKVVGGFSGGLVGFHLASGAWKRTKHAYKAGDGLGMAQGGLQGASSLSYGTISSLFATDGLFKLQGALAPTSAVHVIPYLGIAMYAAHFINAIRGHWVASQFSDGLNQSMNGKRGPEPVYAALKYLRSQIYLTAQEMQNIDSLPTKKQEKQMAKLLQKKWNRFEDAVGAECAQYVRRTLPEFFDGGKHVHEGGEIDLLRASKLILTVQKANHAQKVRYRLTMIIALVGVAAMTVSLLVASGPAAPALFALASLLWFSIDWKPLYNKMVAKTIPKSIQLAELKLKESQAEAKALAAATSFAS